MKTQINFTQGFSRLQTEDHVVDLCKTPADRLKHIVGNTKDFYGFFEVPKKDGGKREIRPPKKELKAVQSRIKKLFDTFKWPEFVQGGIKNRSIFTNAKLHTQKQMVAWLDVKKFFPSTTEVMVTTALLRIGIGEPSAGLMAGLCTYINTLPQGAPSSVCLANLVFLETDYRFYKLCQKHKLSYSRYIDDISISGNIDIRSFKGEFIKLIEQAGYKIADNKITFAGRDIPQIVNNLIVNDKIRPTKKFISLLKEDIRGCWPGEIGPEIVANMHGLSVGQLKSNIRGRLNFLKQFDKKIYREVRGLLVKVKW